MAYVTTQGWIESYTSSQENNPSKTVLNEVVPMEQSPAACGPATFGVIFNTVFKTKIPEPVFVEEFKTELLKDNIVMEDSGVPPRFIIQMLENKGINFHVKESDTTFNDRQIIDAAISKLEQELLEGNVCLTPIQYTPSRWLINTKTNEIVIEDDIDITDYAQGELKVVRTAPNWDGVSTPIPYEGSDSIMATSRNNVDYNGHYLLVVGMTENMGREFFITFDTSYAKLQRWAMEKKPLEERNIDPRYYGYRFIEKDIYAQKWHDISGEGEPFNQYYIAVNVNKAEN